MFISLPDNVWVTMLLCVYRLCVLLIQVGCCQVKTSQVDKAMKNSIMPLQTGMFLLLFLTVQIL